MTKAQIVKELHNRGQMWANEAYRKDQLEKALANLNDAESMSFEELKAHLAAQGKL